jgi:hypothetical protein
MVAQRISQGVDLFHQSLISLSSLFIWDVVTLTIRIFWWHLGMNLLLSNEIVTTQFPMILISATGIIGIIG